ncbi:MAG: DinB family protein [Fimbriimonadaceae bacterium]|nr:DinB family protein [Fimbriimonadaceae bacterium]
MAKPAEFTLHDRLKARLRLVREDLEEILPRLSDSDLSWAPTEGMRTVGGQFIEIAATEIMLLAWMKEGRHITFKEAESFAEGNPTLEELIGALKSARADTLAYLDSLTAEQLETPAPFPDRWFESLGQPMMQPSEAFRSLAAHEWYHVGQLVSYLWSRGDDPYKW